MLADDGRVVLMDFGTGLEVEVSRDAAPAGTPLYLAPELFAGGSATEASDLYSLGVLLFRMVAGMYPVKADDVRGLREAHARDERLRLRDVRSDVPARLARVVDRLLDSDPARRGGGANALALELSTIRRGRLGNPWAQAAMVAAGLTIITGLAWATRSDPPVIAVPGPVVDPAAQQAYLMARGLIEKRGIENARRAAALFEEVIRLDPSNARAWAGRANAYGELSMTYDGMPLDEALPILRESALHAIKLDRTLAEAHAAMGLLHTRDFNWDASVAAYRRALEFDPALSQAATA